MASGIMEVLPVEPDGRGDAQRCALTRLALTVCGIKRRALRRCPGRSVAYIRGKDPPTAHIHVPVRRRRSRFVVDRKRALTARKPEHHVLAPPPDKGSGSASTGPLWPWPHGRDGVSADEARWHGGRAVRLS